MRHELSPERKIIQDELKELIAEHGEFMVREELYALMQSCPTTYVSPADVAYSIIDRWPDDTEQETQINAILAKHLDRYDLQEIADKVGEGDMDSYWMALQYAVEDNCPELVEELEAAFGTEDEDD